MSTDVERLRSQFLVEATELLNEIETLALELESGNGSEDAIRQLFRHVHTLKGAAGMFGFPRPEAFLHQFEFLLDSFRSNRLEFRPEHSALILESADLVRRMLFENYDDATAEAGLTGRITSLSGASPGIAKPPAPAAASPTTSTVPAMKAFTITARFSGPVSRDQLKSFLDGLMTAGSLEVLKNGGPGPLPASINSGDTLVLVMQTEMAAADLNAILEFADLPCTFQLDEGAPVAMPAPVQEPAAPESDFEEPAAGAAEAHPTPEAAPAATAAPRQGDAEQRAEERMASEAAVETTMRIQIDILEKLMNLVSELVLNRNQLLQLVQKDENSRFSLPVQQLNRLISSLQEAVMQTRMQPVGNAWTKLPRMVRDLSVELGKKIDLVQTGAKTELDRHIIQVIQEPLLHLVRNAVDHGIEMPAVRRAAGKPETGTLKLNAYHEAGQIVIEISDDGGGIDPNVIRKKVVEKGWMKSDEAAKLSRTQLFDYLFEAGFSTKDTVTRISGRGVGLDAVKKSLEKVGGNIDLQSVPGKGTSFKIKIPLTLAIISALIVRDNDMVFAIPQISIQELVLVNAGNADKIDHVHEAMVYHLRDELLPLISLAELLGGSRPEDFTGSYIVVLQLADLRFGLIVDEVMNIQEIVVKPISRFAKSLNLYSGSTIIGGSDIILILDTNGISQKAKLLSESLQLSKHGENTLKSDEGEKTTLLLVGTGKTVKAIPLDLVDRLEELDPQKVEFVDGRPVIQYRGRVLALHEVPDPLPAGEGAVLRTVVFKNGNRVAGLVVKSFEDVVDQVLDMDVVEDSPGVLGWSVVAGRSMEIVDAGYYMDFKADVQADVRTGTRTVFVVEESAFVRNHIKFLLKSARYRVLTAADAGEAARMLREGLVQADAVMVGTEMRSMNIRSFVTLLRETGFSRGKPLIAVSTLNRIPEPVAALFDASIEGLDKKVLLEGVELSFHLVTERN